MQEIVALLVGFFVGILINLRSSSSKKHKKFVCGHCDSEDTLQIRKIKDNNVFTCSFCGRIIDEDLLRIMYKEDYEMLKKNPEQYELLRKSRLEGNGDGITSEKDN